MRTRKVPGGNAERQEASKSRANEKGGKVRNALVDILELSKCDVYLDLPASEEIEGFCSVLKCSMFRL